MQLFLQNAFYFRRCEKPIHKPLPFQIIGPVDLLHACAQPFSNFHTFLYFWIARRMDAYHAAYPCWDMRLTFHILVKSLNQNMCSNFASPSKQYISVLKMKTCKWNGWIFLPKRQKETFMIRVRKPTIPKVISCDINHNRGWRKVTWTQYSWHFENIHGFIFWYVYIETAVNSFPPLSFSYSSHSVPVVQHLCC